MIKSYKAGMKFVAVQGHKVFGVWEEDQFTNVKQALQRVWRIRDTNSIDDMIDDSTDQRCA